uniref:Transmembrane protein 107 n=1 Tax=Amphimedon queenslandica TaxID=400682 RepID=A0A1X7UYX2_AMPQE
MAATTTIIPCRFLALMAHLVITVMLYWSREPNVLACTNQGVVPGSDQYSTKDTQLLVAVSLSLACLIVEVVGLVTGLSMFSNTTNILSIALHVTGSILISLYVVDVWSCDIYWTIFAFFCFLPFVVEVFVIAYTLKFKVFN